MKKPLLFSLLGAVLIGSFITSCTKEEKLAETTPAPTLLDQKYQFVGKVGADNVNITVGVDGGSMQIDTYDFDFVTDSSRRIYQSSFSDFFSEEYISISKGSIEFLDSLGLPNTTVKNYFAKGAYPIFSDASSESDDGVGITYHDKDGNVWYSHTGPQTSSSFVITDMATKTEFNKPAAVVKATINCKVYSLDGTQSKTLTNCQLIAAFVDPVL